MGNIELPIYFSMLLATLRPVTILRYLFIA